MDSTAFLDLDDLAERVADRVIDRLAPRLSGAALPNQDDKLLNETEAALFLALQPSTLAAWRCRGGGPAFIRVGSGKKPAIRYRLGDLRTWAGERRHANTAHRIGTSDGAGEEG
jgi:hypothetical protein